MKKIPFLILISALLFSSCDKKSKTPSQPSSTGGSTTTSFPTLSPSTGGDMCALNTTYTYFDYDGTVSKDSMVIASFYASPSTSVPPTNIFGGMVFLNGISIPFQTNSSVYYKLDSLSMNLSGPLTWSVSGSGTVTAFSQAYTPSYPKYSGGNLLPDTCIKANGITIIVSGVTNNQNSVTVLLRSSTNSVSKYILGSNGTVNFSASELSSFTTNQSLTIGIYLTNSFTATHNGVKHGFQNGLNYQKISFLK